MTKRSVWLGRERRKTRRRSASRLPAGGRLALAILALLTQMFAGGAAWPEATPASEWRWRWSDHAFGASSEGLVALAADPASGRLAIADAQRVAVGIPGAPRSWRAAIAGVRDLAFDEEGALWVASATGFWRAGEDGRVEDWTPRQGPDARQIARLAIGAGFFALATHGGVYVSRDANRWDRVFTGFPRVAMADVALRRVDASSTVAMAAASDGGGVGAAELFATSGPRLYRATVVADGSAAGFSALRERDVTPVGRPASEAALEIELDLPGADRVLVHASSLLVLPPRSAAAPTDSLRINGQHRAEQSRAHDWQLWRPVLPPGSSIRSLCFAVGRFWLATDHGLLSAEALAGPWRRALAPALRADVTRLAELAGRLYVASRTGLLVGEPAESPAPPVALVARDDEGGSPAAAGHSTLLLDSRTPPIRAVHQAALRHQGLEVARLRDARRGLSRRGWLPGVALRIGGDRHWSQRWDVNRTFSYGAYHDLDGEDQDRSNDLDGSILLTWDLGDIAYDPELVDLSREERQVVALRDDVLDEIDQIYFERRALLIQLAAAHVELATEPAALPVERLKLELRVAELTAGLDAWTGGWFSDQLAAADPDHRTMIE